MARTTSALRSGDVGPACMRGREGSYRPCWRRAQRVFFRSFLCFFFRIFLRRFLMSEPKLRTLLIRSEQTPEVNTPGPQILVQTNGAQSKRLGRLCHGRHEPQDPLVLGPLKIPETQVGAVAV